MFSNTRTLTWAGIVLWAVGLATLVYGVTNLGPSIEGAYFDRPSFGDPTGAFTNSVVGKGWVIAGIVLVTAGGVALIAAALRRD